MSGRSSSCREDAAGRRPVSGGESAAGRAPVRGGENGGSVVRFRAPLDPYRVSREFPEQWQAFCQRHYRGPIELARAFCVAEATARRWWDGTGGVRALQLVVAVQLHPEDALRTFHGVELGEDAA